MAYRITTAGSDRSPDTPRPLVTARSPYHDVASEDFSSCPFLPRAMISSTWRFRPRCGSSFRDPNPTDDDVRRQHAETMRVPFAQLPPFPRKVVALIVVSVVIFWSLHSQRVWRTSLASNLSVGRESRAPCFTPSEQGQPSHWQRLRGRVVYYSVG
jgi:hypothetical protein